MRSGLLIIICSLVSACATSRLGPLNADGMLFDNLFTAPSAPVIAEDAIKISEPMRDFARTKIPRYSAHVNLSDTRRALIDALYVKGELRLEYFSDVTRSASESFTAKSGNCLSLVLLTAAMAKELKLPYHYQMVVNPTDWNQSGNFFMSIGHVNIVLENIPKEFELNTWVAEAMVVDFLEPNKAATLESVQIEENTILAMYLNNRAVETLLQGKVNDAYWYVRESLHQDDHFLNAYLTLGVIYRTIHRSDLAESVLERIARYYPDNTSLLNDQILVLKDLGRVSETVELKRRLAKLDQERPWSYFIEAQSEFNAGRYDHAKRLYEMELARDPDHHEFEYGLALVYIKLNDAQNAITHLQRAIELCPNKALRDMYKVNLDQIRVSH